MYKQMETGRWVTHLGFERGNAIVEAQQRYVGRPWSRMVKNDSTTTANATTINKLYRLHHIIGYHGRGEPGATVKVHVHGVVIRDVGVDGARKLGNIYWKARS